MPSDSSVTICLEKLRSASTYHKKWWDRFRVSDSIKYYEGQQWAGYANYFKRDYRPCVVNLVFSTIEVQLPSLLFSQPIFNLTPKKSTIDPEKETRRTQLQEAALNTFVTDPDNLFAEEIEDAIIDSYFAFGLIEVGFDSNYIINPNAQKPYIRDDGTQISDIEGKDLVQPDEIPEWEQVFVKRIHPNQFRVGGMDSKYLSRCNWVAYYEYVHLEDVKGNKALSHLKDIQFTGSRTEEFDRIADEESPEFNELMKTGDVLKVWHWWDLRSRKFKLFTPSYEKDNLFEGSYSLLPLYSLKYHNRRRGFYPVPPVSQWLSSQDDLNEANEQVRVHRRRGARKYLVRKGAFTLTDDLDALMDGPDGTHREVEGDPATAIAPVPLAPLESSVDKTLVLSKDNFNIVAGSSSESRGEADRTTATATAIKDARAKIRETRPKIIIANWLNNIARHILLMQQRITLPFWIQIQEKPNEQLMGNVEETKTFYEEITGMDIDGIDFSVNINIASMSPISAEEDKNKFLEFMAVIHNYPEIALSPTLIRETAERIGYKTNEKVIRDLQNMALLNQATQMQQVQNAVSPLAQRSVAKATPNNNERITNQLTNQVGLPTQ